MESFRCFNIFQNCLGLVFRRSGSQNYNTARYFLHMVLYSLYASRTITCFFPCARFNRLYFYRASLHASLNHGAMCFAHLFGLRQIFMGCALITPAFFASLIKNSSILLVLTLLSWLNQDVIVLNSYVKRAMLLCIFHFLILSIYSFVLSFPIHSYLS